MTRIERESVNFKLPKPVVDALRKAALDRNTTATDLVIQGLHQILADVPGIETRLTQLEANLSSGSDTSIETRVLNLETKLETTTTRLAQLEGAIAVMQQSLNT
jgi:hypothetical protein